MKHIPAKKVLLKDIFVGYNRSTKETIAIYNPMGIAISMRGGNGFDIGRAMQREINRRARETASHIIRDKPSGRPMNVGIRGRAIRSI